MTDQIVGNDADTAADPLALDQQVCFALVVAARSVVALYRPVLDRLGLTHPQYLVMLALWQHAPLSVKRLSELLQLDPGTLSPLLKRLEAANLLTRRRAVADERLLAVELTGRGLELRKQALDVPPAIVARLGMAVPELQALHASLTRVIAAANPAVPSSAGSTATAVPSSVGSPAISVPSAGSPATTVPSGEVPSTTVPYTTVPYTTVPSAGVQFSPAQPPKKQPANTARERTT